MNALSTIQGVAASQLLHADAPVSVCDAVRECSANRRLIIDYGDFHPGLGHAPPPDHVRIRQTGGVVEHYVADMTIRARAATPIADLAAALAEEHQWLPMDGFDTAISVGEAVAHNATGPLSTSFGTWRDLLLGLRYVNAAGESISVGGRTVKNVAGYDMTKLMVGNLNTLGVLTELTLRTYAAPEQVTQVTVQPFCPTKLDAHGTALLTSDAAPIYIDFQFPDQGRPTLHVGYSGTARACDLHVEALQQWLGDVGSAGASVERQDGELGDDASRRTARRTWRAETSGLVKLVVPAAQTGVTIHNVRHSGIAAHTTQSMPSEGVIWIGGRWDLAHAQQADERITAVVGQVGGFRVWHRRPDDSPAISPFAPAQEDEPMLRRIKHALDPGNIFNPGRLHASV